MIIHLDGDLLVYRCGFAAEKMHYTLKYYDDVFAEERMEHFPSRAAAQAFMDNNPAMSHVNLNGTRVPEPVENALYNVKSMVRQTLGALEADERQLRLYLSGRTNYREGIATIKPYKGNRDPDHRPVHGPAIKEYMEEHYETIYSEDEEADDTIGIAQYRMWCRDPYSTCIATVDKDLDMIPGLHYNFVKEDSYYVDEDRAMRFFYHQLLTGDSTDNIPGVPGIGPAKAATALAGVEGERPMYLTCLTLYVQSYGDEFGRDALIENARLLWIRRQEDEFWNPPEELNATD